MESRELIVVEFYPFHAVQVLEGSRGNIRNPEIKKSLVKREYGKLSGLMDSRVLLHPQELDVFSKPLESVFVQASYLVPVDVQSLQLVNQPKWQRWKLLDFIVT